MIRPNHRGIMEVERTDTYEHIGTPFTDVVVSSDTISIKTGGISRGNKEEIRQLAQHLMQWVETGSLVIPVLVSDVMIMRQELIDNGCLTDFNGAPINLQEMVDKLPNIPKVILHSGERRRFKPMLNPQVVEVTPNGTKIIKDGLPTPGEPYEHPPDNKPDG